MLKITGIIILWCISAATVTQTQQDNFQAALRAIREPRTGELEKLLNDDPKLVTKKDRQYGATLLHWAAARRDTVAIKLLLDHHAEPTAVNDERSTPLLVAIASASQAKLNEVTQKQFLEIVGSLATPEVINLRNVYGKTALHLASQYGELEVLQLLLNLGADPRLQTETGKTPLDYAKSEDIRSLLRARMGPVPPVGPAPPLPRVVSKLELAINNSDLEQLRQILSSQVTDEELNQKNPDGDTPLMVAAKRCNTKAVALLIKRGAKEDIHDQVNRSFLEVCRQPSITPRK